MRPSGTLGARHIIFFVIAAAAPLGFAVGSIPLAIGRGGIGTAAMFLIAGGFLALFAVGYVAMTRFVPNAGALFSYITAGLGRPLGIGVAFVAALSYALVSAGAVGPFSVFAEQTAQSLFGVAVPWPVWAIGGVVVMGILGQLNVELNLRVLGFFMIAEVTVLAILGMAVIAQGGADRTVARCVEPGRHRGRADRRGSPLRLRSLRGIRGNSTVPRRGEASRPDTSTCNVRFHRRHRTVAVIRRVVDRPGVRIDSGGRRKRNTHRNVRHRRPAIRR